MLSYVYSWYYNEDVHKPPTPPPLINKKISIDKKIGAGRNLPLHLLIKDAKNKLKSTEISNKLKEMNLLNNVLVIKHKLKRIKTRKPITDWPCTNPLFIELRNKVKLYN